MERITQGMLLQELKHYGDRQTFKLVVFSLIKSLNNFGDEKLQGLFHYVRLAKLSTVILIYMRDIGLKFKDTNSTCPICFEQYNRKERTPTIICKMHHTICKSCLKQMERRMICPFCKSTVNRDQIVQNNYISDLLSSQNPEIYQQTTCCSTCCNSQVCCWALDYCLFEENRACDERPYRLGKDRVIAYFLIVFFQIPLSIFSIILPQAQPDEQCLKYSQHTETSFRSWFITIGILELILVFLFLLMIIFLKLKCIQMQNFNQIQTCFGVIAIAKSFMWGIFEINLFFNRLLINCSGLIYFYCLIVLTVHGIVIISLCKICDRAEGITE